MGNKTQKLSNVVDQIVEWQAVVTADGSTGLTAVAGRGYFIDTTSGAITVTLPASPKIGDTITITDYASTFNTNNVTINPNGNKIEAGTANGLLSTNDQTHTLVFTDSTQGWKIVNQDTASDIQPTFISATGGTVTTSGDFKIHSFTGDGCFVVATVGNPIGSTTVDYLVVAGGGGGGSNHGGGGGAGGFRESSGNSGPYTASPLATPTGITVSTTTYPISVGAGGASVEPNAGAGNDGSNSVFSTITSTGGGGGGGEPSPVGDAKNGGSGGGQYDSNAKGNGNTPPVSPPQGNPGGNSGHGPPSYGEGGGGGAGAAGGNGTSTVGGNGGAGATTSILGSPTAYAGGGGGSTFNGGTAGTGGTGGGGNGTRGGSNVPGSTCGTAGTAGAANTGGGGGGGERATPNGIGFAGGSGIVIIRYKFQ